MKDQPRLTNLFANEDVFYSYSDLSLTTEFIPDFLLPIKIKIEKAFRIKFNSILINYYRNGNDFMDCHSYIELELGVNPTIASLSLGAKRKFVFHSKNKVVKINPLEI